MTKQELLELIKFGEGYTLEFKESVGKDLGREICALANGQGGRILIGVTDAGLLRSISDSNKVRSEIRNFVRQISPPIDVHIEFVDGICCVTIPEHSEKPGYCNGTVYLRIGADSQKLTRQEIIDFHFKEGNIRYEEMVCRTFSLPVDLSVSQYALFAARANIPDEIEPTNALENLYLLHDKGMKNAGVWLLANDIRKFFANATVTCCQYRGIDNTTVIDRVELTGDVVSNFHDAMDFLQTHLKTAYVVEKRKREERLEFPEVALRESIMNAIGHRDYRSGANIQIHLYADRLEIINPGGLPKGMTPALLGKRSVPRNPLLFTMLHRMGFVEKIGSGISRIHKTCENYGVKAPTITTNNEWYTIVFARMEADGTSQLKSQLESQLESRPESRPESQPESQPESLVAQKILNALKSAVLSKSELASRLGLKSISGQLKIQLTLLMNARLIEFTIPEKPNSRLQKYRITAKGKSALKR